MSRSSSLILLGILVMLVPFSGLPSSIRTLLFVIFGAITLAFGITERVRTVRESRASLERATTPESVVSEPAHSHGVSPI